MGGFTGKIMQKIFIKEDNKAEDILKMTSFSIIVLGHLKYFCEQHDLPLKITNILKKFPESISNTHPEGRAFDISLKGWSELNIIDCKVYLEEKCLHLAPISLRTGKHRLVLRHNIGLGDHLHIQVKRI